MCVGGEGKDSRSCLGCGLHFCCCGEGNVVGRAAGLPLALPRGASLCLHQITTQLAPRSRQGGARGGRQHHNHRPACPPMAARVHWQTLNPQTSIKPLNACTLKPLTPCTHKPLHPTTPPPPTLRPFLCAHTHTRTTLRGCPPTTLRTPCLRWTPPTTRGTGTGTRTSISPMKWVHARAHARMLSRGRHHATPCRTTPHRTV